MTKRLTTKQIERAFTLVEMLIAMALTLILVFAVAEFYAYVGAQVRDGRALIEMGSQLRAAAQQLQDDLNSLTLRPEPWIDPTASPGYFTVYEGPRNDAYPDLAGTDVTADTNNNQVPDAVENMNITTLIGDGDDMFAMTIRAKDTPFQGQVWDNTRVPPGYANRTSQYAEVIWYTSFTDLNGNSSWDINEPRFLCRRQLLILPNEQIQLPPGVNSVQYFQEAEVSFHLNASNTPIPNTLADLSLRHNRFGCQTATPTYPSHMYINPTNTGSVTAYSMQGARMGEDRVLPNLLAFDVRVYDPLAPIYQDASATAAVVPGDVGYSRLLSGGSPTQIGVGAWVDLSYNRTLNAGAATSYFSGPPTGVFNLPTPSGSAQPYNFHQWDTWAQSYEMPNLGLGPGFNGTGFPGTGQAFNGLDDNGQYGVDDASERQTAPPYAAPLRGVQVRVRIYEPQTRQARQVTVGADFVAD